MGRRTRTGPVGTSRPPSWRVASTRSAWASQFSPTRPRSLLVDAEDIRRARDTLAGRVEESTRQLAESNALLATEIADRTQAEAARMRLLRRLVVAQEEERRRIARDLHDDLGQRLTALRLTLEALETGARGRAELSQAIAEALEMLAHIDKGSISWPGS